MVPPASHRVSRVRRYSGDGRRPARVRVRGSNPVPRALPGPSATARVCDRTMAVPTTPAGPELPPVWPDPRSLAATRGISVDFSSSGYLDVSVPRVASRRAMSSPGGGAPCRAPGFPIRRPAGRRACAPRRGLSQLAASFFGFQCQGIHRAPLTSSLRFESFKWVISHPSRSSMRLLKTLRKIRNVRSRDVIASLRYAALRVREGEPSGPDAATLGTGSGSEERRAAPQLWSSLRSELSLERR